MFRTHATWRAAVVLGALCVAAQMQAPLLLHMSDPLFRGVLVQLNSDEDVYLAHLQESLSGRPEQSSEAIVGDPSLRGSHAGTLERIEGEIFRPTRLRAASVEQIMDSLIPPAIFLALILFFSLCGFSRWASFLGACAFVAIELYSLNRPVQPRGSFLILLLALSGIIAGLERSDFAHRRRLWILGCIGGALLGILVGVYFWAWTFGWLWMGLLFLSAVAQWMKERSPEQLRRFERLCLFAAAGALAAAPALWELRTLVQQPFYVDAVFRSGMHAGRLPESWSYSILFALMMFGALSAWWKDMRGRAPYAAITVITAFIAIHQQALHGTVFNFVSHYQFALVTAAICVILLWNASSAGRKPAFVVSGLAALVYLGAIAYDGRHIVNQWTVRASRFDEQHFSTLLPVLDALPRATILSDPTSSLFVAASTRHDVVYTLYLKNVLMSHGEIAARFCTTQIPVAPIDRHLEREQPIYPDADSAYSGDPSVAAREREMVKEACDAADRRPAQAVSAFHPGYVLWDERRHPEWSLQRLRTPLTKTASGSGWSLWSIDTLNAPR